MNRFKNLLQCFQQGYFENEEGSGHSDAFSGQGPYKAYLPVFLFIALGVWFGIYCSYHFASNISFSFCIAGAIGGLVVASVPLLFFLKGFRTNILFIIVGAALGVSCGFIQGSLIHKERELIDEAPHTAYYFEVVEAMRIGEFGNSCVAEVRTEKGTSLKVKVFFSDSSADVGFREIFLAPAALKPIPSAAADYYWEQGIVATASVGKFEVIERHDIIGSLLAFRSKALSLFDAYDNDGAVFLRAILFGERTELNVESEFYHAVKVAGLAHLVAVSGAHLVIVTSLFSTMLAVLRFPRSGIVIVQIIFILVYLVCAGIPLSAVRAAFMALLSLTSLFARRASSAINALGLCLCCILLASPLTALSISLMLSAGATLGILLFSPLFSAWFVALFKKRTFVGDSFATTLSSGVFTSFISAATFSQISLISPLANLVALPFFSFLCGGGLAVVLFTLLAPSLGTPLLDVMVLCAQGLSEAVLLVPRVPLAAIPCSLNKGAALLLSICIGCGLWLMWPKASRKGLLKACGMLTCLVIVSLLINGPTKNNEIIMLDVGQGDAFVIRSQGSTMLIDTGNQTTALLSGLARHGIYSLDAVLITHADDDHCGSLAALQGIVRIGSVFVARDALDCGCSPCNSLVNTASALVNEKNVVPLDVGDSITIGVFSFEVIWPDRFEDEGGNSDSLSGLMKSDIDSDGVYEWQAFFCGDLEAEQLSFLLKEDRLGDIDIYKVGHHGSRAALTDEVVHTMSPEIALISAGRKNRYGHPTEETLQHLEGVACEVFQTKELGDVICRVYQDRIAVESYGVE